MKVHITLTVKNEHVITDTIDIDDNKLEELSEEEVEGTIEVLLRGWMDRSVRLEWETEGREEEEG